MALQPTYTTPIRGRGEGHLEHAMRVDRRQVLLCAQMSMCHSIHTPAVGSGDLYMYFYRLPTGRQSKEAVYIMMNLVHGTARAIYVGARVRMRTCSEPLLDCGVFLFYMSQCHRLGLCSTRLSQALATLTTSTSATET